ncbi:hypothetical protein BLOT_010277 [Blomia tropicalis]|nr:hypothetical protein BLOT_010277 [Blomia tropicalis]
MSSRITSASRFESSFDSSDSTLSDTSESVRFRCSLVKFDDEQDEEEHDVDERRLCLRFILSSTMTHDAPPMNTTRPVHKQIVRTLNEVNQKWFVSE